MPESYRAKVISQAKKDVGILEGKSNTGAVQKYSKYWNATNPKNTLILTSPYCGLALDYWFKKAGVNHNIEFSPRAINWQKYCENPVPLFNLSASEYKKLKPGGVIVFKNSWGNHVGLYLEYQDFNIYTIEGNTSNARSITKYAVRSEGVFHLKTKVTNQSLKPIYYCDPIKQASPWKRI
jgi:hypothetical protein